MIEINELYNNEDFKKVCLIYKDFDSDDLLKVVFSLGIVASRNVLFKSLLEQELKKGLKD